MSDKKYDDDQEEYKYPDDEQSGDMTMAEETPQSQDKGNDAGDKKKGEENKGAAKLDIDSVARRIRQLPFLKNKRVMIIIIAVIVLFILIKMLGHHSSPSLPKKAQTTQQQSPLQTRYNVIGSQVHDLSTTSIQNKRDVALLTNNMRQMEKSMQSMNDVVVQLTDEVTDLTKQIKTLEAQQAIQKAAIGKVAKIKPKDYYITAMVPGRAWLKSTDSDQGISVRVGDKLPTYGTISSIDSDNGVLVTTSGRIIKFGANDS
jgi:intracellular multiplication protein IcmG